MKSAKDIINHLINYPSYKELKNHSECSKFLEILGRNLSQLVKFCYVKNNILFFVMHHPLGLQEMRSDSSINIIRSLLKTYCDFNKNSILCSVGDIKFFVAKNLTFTKTQAPKSEILFIEPSKGGFKNLAKNKQIYEKFEKIREIIRANLCKNGENFAD